MSEAMVKPPHHIAITTIPALDYVVSTVCMQESHGINVYETMIFINKGEDIGETLDYQTRTVSIIQAIIGHGEAIAWLAEQEQA